MDISDGLRAYVCVSSCRDLREYACRVGSHRAFSLLLVQRHSASAKAQTAAVVSGSGGGGENGNDNASGQARGPS